MTDLELQPVAIEGGLSDRVFEMLRSAVVSMDIYASKEPPKLDERALADSMGVSRTPVREALSRLEQEGLVRNIPRRGSFVVRKTKKEIIEIIQVWAALESMAARLITLHCSDLDLEKFYSDNTAAISAAPVPIDEYSERNIKFHQEIIALSGNEFLVITARRLFNQMHAIRSSTIKHPQRTLASVIDHTRIIEALFDRDTSGVEELVKNHALKLADHVQKNVDF